MIAIFFLSFDKFKYLPLQNEVPQRHIASSNSFSDSVKEQ